MGFLGLVSKDAEYKSGEELLLKEYEAAPDKSIVLFLSSPLTDASEFIQNHEDLFAQKTKRVAIMGGVDITSFEDKVTPDIAALTTPFGSMQNTCVFTGLPGAGSRGHKQ